ncbi:hypothetical protein KJ603_01625 [Patescibacteria group bacterium]|nr:hypothetical protein [Patescibacteria group bacterium]
MLFKFSENLINETIQCFKEENNLDISKKQANEYLDSFADLYLVFNNERLLPLSLEAEESLSIN